ncbi:hypothetical protein KY290_013680 [Solanum tuberosum]|uniref:Uncharacterized protein n=1 Tax=Solanum tuberosum TaxID=4113 RepID=A0ABQ7VMG4_SOLTU|nr:hypothetical protein KY290_013680 [Solanum tuberosum]
MTVKKTPAKREKVKRRTTVKSTRTKGPGPSAESLGDDEEMSREDCIVEMEKQKVLNGRVFDPEIHTAFGMSNLFDAVSLQEWGHLFEPPTPYLYESEVWEFYYKMDLLEDGGVRTTVHDVEIVLDEETLGFLQGPSSEEISSVLGCPRSFLRVLVPRTEKRTVASAVDLFLIEKLDELEEINLSTIMLEHMHLMTWKKAKHVIPNGYLQNYVFKHFEVPLGRGVSGTTK